MQTPAWTKSDAESWSSLPEEITVRYIRFGYQTRLGKKQPMILVTTLLDPVKHPATEIAKLYASRWEIEVKLRDLKTNLGMECFAVRSPAMARKTLAMMMVAHSLVPAMMQRAGQQAGVRRAQVSFRSCVDLLLSWQGRHRGPRAGRKRAASLEWDLLELLASRKLLLRPGRREPRAVKLREKSYSKLTRPRGEFKEIEQRTKKRKACA